MALWVEVAPEEPFIGPPHPGACVDGMESHVWTLVIEEGCLSLHCPACRLCDVGMEYVPMEMWSGEFQVKLSFHHEHHYDGDVDAYMDIQPEVL